MKHISIYKKLILPACLAVVGLLSSCSMFDDFLTLYPSNQITGEQFWEDKNDINSVLASCYKQLTTSDVARRMFVWGELRSDNFVLRDESSEDIRNIVNANLLPTNSWYNWSSFYKGIGFCNLVLSKGMEVVEKDPSFTVSDWAPIAAECKALRAIYYFYLIRAFRDVPMNLLASDTSEGVREPVQQTLQEDVLKFLIDDLESCKDDGMEDYGNDVYNRGRITKDAIYTLLADIYLWRACKNASADSQAVYGNQYIQDYQKVLEYSDFVINRKLYEFQKEHETYYGQTNPSLTPLPLLVPTTMGRIEDVPYNSLFGTKHSIESIFEVAFDGTNNSNSLVSYFYGDNYGGFQPGILGASVLYQSYSNNPETNNIAYSVTDLRIAESVRYTNSSSTSETSTYPVVKYVTQSITVLDGTNVNTKANNVNNVVYGSYRNRNDVDANWILYRASDVILMKAEAIASLALAGVYADDDPILQDAFNLTNSVFMRSNPMLEQRYRLSFNNYSAPETLFDFIIRERQREFFAEGKRWFDLVRIAMRDNNCQRMLNLLTVKYTSNASAIKAKLATLNSLFSPVYREEMKVNPALWQNPAWIVDDNIQRN